MPQPALHPVHSGSVNLSRRALLGASGAYGGLTLLSLAGSATAAGLTARPWTIPALREWTPRTGTFTLSSTTQVVLRPGDADRLTDAAALLADDLQTLTGTRPPVVVRSATPQAGEIHLRLGAGDAQLGQEGYRLDVGKAAIVTANGVPGAFYGTRSLLQMLGQTAVLPAGLARDWPRYAWRGLMLDIGRKHLTYDWIADHIRTMGFLKLNYLHLHFTEDLGWRIESDRVPRLHSAEFLTKTQVASLVALAARYQITVVPEIDVPGHMGAALASYPQFQLRDLFGQAATNKLDYTIPEARTFVRELIEEYLPLFPGPDFHIGVDEFLSPLQFGLYPQLQRYATATYGAHANVQDGIIGFANQLVALLRSHGKTTRAAHDGTNDGVTQRLDTETILEWWTDVSPLGVGSTIPTPQQLLDRGHRIVNAGWYPTYYSNLGIPLPPKPDLEGMYETWAVHRFRGPLFLDGTWASPYLEVSPTEPGNLGSRLAVWNDDPTAETEAQIAAGIHPRLRIMAQKTWESPLLVPTYAEFAGVITRVGDPR